MQVSDLNIDPIVSFFKAPIVTDHVRGAWEDDVFTSVCDSVRRVEGGD